MTLLNTADKLYLGSQAVDRVYLGAQQIWPTVVAGSALGAHTMLKQPDNGGSSPATTAAIATQASGSSFWVGVGGWAYANLPTDSQGNTYALTGDKMDWGGKYPNEDEKAYVCLNGIGGSGHTVTLDKSDVDSAGELSMPFVEVEGATAVKMVDVYDATASDTHIGPSITVDGPAFLISMWSGDSAARGQMTADPGQHWTVIEQFLNVPEASCCQMAVAVRQVDAAGTYSVTWGSVSPAQGAEVSIYAFDLAPVVVVGPTLIQSTVNPTAGGQNSVTSPAIDTTAGHTFVVFVAAQNSGTSANACTVSDSKGNTYTQVLAPTWCAGTNDGGFPSQYSAYMCTDGVGGAGHTFSAAVQGGFPSIFVVEVSAGAQLDVLASATSLTTDPYSSGTVTTTVDNDLLVSFQATGGANGAPIGTPGDGFSKIQEMTDDNGWTGTLSAKSATTAGAYSDSISFTSTPDVGSVLVALKGTGGGGGGTTAMGLSGTLPDAIAGTAYSGTLTLTGDYTAPVAIDASVGTIPNWMTPTVSGATVTFAGTAPAATETDVFTVRATDSSATPQVATSAQSVAVTAAPATFATFSRTQFGTTLSNGELTVTCSGSGGTYATLAAADALDAATANAYWEATVNADASPSEASVGIGRYDYDAEAPGFNFSDPPDSWGLSGDGKLYAGQSSSSGGVAYAVNDVVMMCLKNGKLYVGTNGTWVGDPVAETGAVFTGLTGDVIAAVGADDSKTHQWTFNFGATAWAHTPPAGATGWPGT